MLIKFETFNLAQVNDNEMVVAIATRIWWQQPPPNDY